jgi:hypothetical protein
MCGLGHVEIQWQVFFFFAAIKQLNEVGSCVDLDTSKYSGRRGPTMLGWHHLVATITGLLCPFLLCYNQSMVSCMVMSGCLPARRRLWEVVGFL